MADNPLDDSDGKREQRVRERAYHLWDADGRPQGRDAEFWERARELIGMEESAGAGLLPNPMTHETMLSGQPEGVEEAAIQENLGAFPDRLSDQGEWQPTPSPKAAKRERRGTVEQSTRGAASRRNGPTRRGAGPL